MPGTAILSPGVGYGIVIAIAVGFSILMIGITKLQNRYTKYKQSSLSEFASASHSVKPGLIACAIVSSWSEFQFPFSRFLLFWTSDLHPRPVVLRISQTDSSLNLITAWAATLLTSSAQAYSNGMGGGWFYGAGTFAASSPAAS